jgi:amino-acid N-acetyltransferase
MTCFAEDAPVEPIGTRGAGTPTTIAPARSADIAAIQAFVDAGVRSEELLPRSTNDIARQVRDFVMLRHGDEAVGVGSVSLVAPTTAEIGVVCAPDDLQTGRVIDHLLHDARDLGAETVFVVTRQAAVFEALGFERSSTASFPTKRSQCLRCARAPRCRQQVWSKSLV